MTQQHTSDLTCTDGLSAGDHISGALEQMYVALFGKPRQPEMVKVESQSTPRVASHATAIDYTIL